MPYAFLTGRQRSLNFAAAFNIGTALSVSGPSTDTGNFDDYIQALYRNGTGTLQKSGAYVGGLYGNFANIGFNNGLTSTYAKFRVAAQFTYVAAVTALHYYTYLGVRSGPYADVTMYLLGADYATLSSFSIPHTYQYRSGFDRNYYESDFAAEQLALMTLNPPVVEHSGQFVNNFPSSTILSTTGSDSGTLSITAQLEEIYWQRDTSYPGLETSNMILFRERIVPGTEFISKVKLRDWYRFTATGTHIVGDPTINASSPLTDLYYPASYRSSGASLSATCTLGSMTVGPTSTAAGSQSFPYDEVTDVGIENYDFADVATEPVTISINPLDNTGEGAREKTITGLGTIRYGRSSSLTVDTSQRTVRFSLKRRMSQGVSIDLTGIYLTNLQARPFDFRRARFDASGLYILGNATETWSANPDLSVTTSYPSGNTLRIVVGSEGTSIAPIDRWIKTTKSGSPLRLLKLRYRSVGSANQPLFVNAGDGYHTIHGWTVTTGADGEWKIATLDLLQATDPSATPVEGIYNLSEVGNLLGFNSIEFRKLAYGVTYEIEYLKPVATTVAGSVLEAGLSGADAFEGVSDGYPTRPASYPDVATTAPWLMDDLSTPLSGGPDYSIDPGDTFYVYNESHLLDNRLYHLALEGYDGGGKILDRGLPLTIRGILVAQTIDLYPGCGDIATLEYAPVNRVRARYVWRSGAHGVSITPDKTQYGNRRMAIESRDAAHDNARRGTPDTWGSGVPGDLGYWKTGIPWAPGYGWGDRGDGKNWQPRVCLLPPYTPSGGAELTHYYTTSSEGTRQWFLVLATRTDAVIRWLSADLSPTLRAVRAEGDGAGGIRLSFADYTRIWTDIDTGLMGMRPCARYDRLTGSVTLVYEDSGAIVRRTTANEGRTFGGTMTIFSTGTYPTFCATPTGVTHHFCVAGGAIKTRILDAQQTEMVASTTVVSSGVADDALAAFERAGIVYLLYRNTSGAIITVSSSDGITYA